MAKKQKKKKNTKIPRKALSSARRPSAATKRVKASRKKQSVKPKSVSRKLKKGVRKPVVKKPKSPIKPPVKSKKNAPPKVRKLHQVPRVSARVGKKRKPRKKTATAPVRAVKAKKNKSRRSSSPKRTGYSRRSSSRKSITSSLIKIKVVGVGGGGGNAITRMRKTFSVRGVEFIAINTDLQDLESCDASRKLHIGRALTKGMGAGMNPELGQQAAEENRSEIAEALKGADMIFLTAGFGGGTGTGASPIIADVAREIGILTVAIVTKPFAFEGAARMRIAEDGMAKIKDKVDTLLAIPNDRIFSVIDKNTPVIKAFEKIDDILQSAVQGVAEVISSSGLVNVDFADIRAVMSEAGLAVIGVGSASGADRAVKAVNQAIHSPLLDISIDGARSVLFGVGGKSDLRMAEVNDAAKIITDSVDPGARIIFGAYNDRKLRAGEIKIVLIAAGFNGMALRKENDSLTLFADDLDLIDSPEKGANSRGRADSESVSKSDKSKKSTSKSEEEGEDVWDIPTFLRKKGRRG